MNRWPMFGVVALFAFLVVGGVGLSTAAPPAPPPTPAPAAPETAAAEDIDASMCASCHDKAAAGMQGTGHAGVEKSCASCHSGVRCAPQGGPGG